MSAGMRPDSTGMIAPSDLMVAATLPLLAIVARAVPESRWPGASRFLAACKPLDAELRRRRMAHLERGLGLEPAAARRVVAEFRAAHLEERLQVLKERSRAGWSPSIRLDGEARLRQALAGGHGAILWVTNAVLASLVVKKALQARGYSVHHLSRPTHGLSTTRFGIRWLNPVRTRIEERYVTERVVMTQATTVAAMRRLKLALERGETVSITVGDWARRTLLVPFLGAHLRLATGPATLAARTGAPLLPVFLTRAGAQFLVSIDEALPVSGEGEENGMTALEVYARKLESWVRLNPELWNGWDSLE
jgi:predicted LPLAT superfamily acyltransferase